MFRQEHWLNADERRDLIEDLLHAGIIRFNNNRSLLLKKGVTTDIYIDLRNLRSHPKLLKRVSTLFGHALRRLDIDRFIEVPVGISCVAGVLAVDLPLPYLTIREEEKSGRVTKGKIVGEYRRNETAVIIDDVITGGASKVVPFKEGIAAGLRIKDLWVLVDRQQGWEKTFQRENVPLRVHSGITLHQIRRHLIEEGVMERCDPHRESNNPIVVALDGKNWEDVLPIADELRPSGCILKANDLFFEHGMDVIGELSVYGRVMLDGKFHDIPNTVVNACKRLKRYAPWAITVHASGGEEMLRQAVSSLEGTGVKVLAVTVLTSIDRETCQEIYLRAPDAQVEALARIANEAGVHGFVCSPEEVSDLRARYPNKTLVVPGVRSPGAEQGDQKRIATPQEAISRGATHLVMGRQILGATNPVEEVKRVMTKELDLEW